MWPDGRDSGGDSIDARYVISVVAQLTGLHPQTLRQYDRLDIVRPERSVGRGRRYSQEHVRQLRRVQDLTAAGVNLEGVRRILALEAQVEQLRLQVRRFGGQPVGQPYEPQDSHPHLPVPYITPGTSLVLWSRHS